MNMIQKPYPKENRNEKNSSLSKSKSAVFSLIGFAAAVFLDQWSKYLAVFFLKDQPAKVLIQGIFELYYLENKGAAFGMLQNRQFIFIAGAVIICIAVVYVISRMPVSRRYIPLRICAVLLCAGAVGNMIDRIRLNYVVDFFYFRLIDFPVFNVADCYVVAACFFFAVLILFYYKEDDDFHFLKKKKG